MNELLLHRRSNLSFENSCEYKNHDELCGLTQYQSDFVLQTVSCAFKAILSDQKD